MSTVTIRHGEAADLDALRQLFRRSSLSNAGDRSSLMAHPDTLELSGDAVAQGRTDVAIDVDGQIVGFVTVADGPGFVELEDLFVDPDSMRQGVGAALVGHVVARARQAGVGRVEVTANPHALAFYRFAGFVYDRDVETRFGAAPRMSLAVMA
jgi:GNAT superfamily N-acetyltransferase